MFTQVCKNMVDEILGKGGEDKEGVSEELKNTLVNFDKLAGEVIISNSILVAS